MKRILIIKACGMQKEEQECNGIINFAQLLELDYKIIKPNSVNEIYSFIKVNGKFNFIYLSAHGNEIGFANENKTISDTWYNLAFELCKSECLDTNCMILLSCCRSGLKEVAYNLFYMCNQISYIIGVKQSLTPAEMVTGFTIFLFGVIVRQLDPVIASDKICKATDLRFIGFDYMETVEDFEYRNYIKNFIKVGDKVTLRSGGVIMTIEQIDNNKQEATCIYNVSDNIKREILKFDTLKIIID